MVYAVLAWSTVTATSVQKQRTALSIPVQKSLYGAGSASTEKGVCCYYQAIEGVVHVTDSVPGTLCYGPTGVLGVERLDLRRPRPRSPPRYPPPTSLPTPYPISSTDLVYATTRSPSPHPGTNAPHAATTYTFLSSLHAPYPTRGTKSAYRPTPTAVLS
eukprot:1485734-Rhodomonas_salina.2